jgi:hypothetical protein
MKTINIELANKKGIADADTFSDTSEDYTDEFINEQLNATIVGDFKQALYEVRFSAPLLVLFVVFLSYHLLISPYRTNDIEQTIVNGINDLVSKMPRMVILRLAFNLSFQSQHLVFSLLFARF